jgi:hypothetical protein
MKKYLALVGFVLTIPAANWMIGNVGTVCIPNGPCLIPVFPGLMAPSGVLMIGLALVLRDVVQEQLGWRWCMGAIVAGAALSGLVAPAALVLASATAFLISESADMAVYTPLRERKLWLAVVASGIVGAFVDSGIFLYLAFGSIDHMTGNVVGKIIMSLLAVPIILVMRRVSSR